MKIVQTPARFYPYTGGIENYTYYLSRELSRMGHEVSVICANEPDAGNGAVNGIKVKRLGYIGKIANTNITPILPYELLRKDFDVIHTHLPTPWSSDWSALISKIRNKPLVLTYHNNITGFGGMGYVAKAYNKTILKFVLGEADKIIITNKKQLEFSPLLTNYHKKISVIPPGVDTKKFKPIKTEKRENSLFFLSVLDRYHEYKGLGYLLEALKLVKNEIKNVKLTVGGSGELIEYYKNMANSLGLKNNVEFMGRIAEEELPTYYNRSELFILPSTSPTQEGFGMVLLEAMACGIPVVSTNLVGLAEEIKEEKAGIIIRPGDAEALADAILKMLKTKPSGNAVNLAKKYKWSKITEKISKIYLSLS